nr:hypothetical protein [Tanacetum cinerariifolium]
MANLSEDIECAGSDTRSSMLDRTDFASWKQRIRLYCQGKENGGPERPRVYSNLSPKEKDRYNVDIQATNILLQGLPKYIYTLISHYTDTKDIWDNVKILLEGSKLTKEDHKSQLYDDFEHFRQYKRETIHDYYVRFAKLINDMLFIKMTMSKMQLNSKFVNNRLLEWVRFVTEVKLNKGLRDSNYDQLYAYLKEHEAHANENKMMLDRFTQYTVNPLALMSNDSKYDQLYAYLKQHETHAKENKMMLDRFSQHTVDPLALMFNVSYQHYYSPSSSTSPSIYVLPHRAYNTHLDSSLSLTNNLIENLTNMLALLTQSYKTFLPQTNNQLRTSSNTRNQATVQDGRVVVQIVYGRQNRGQGMNPWGGDNAIDDDVDEQPVQDLALNVDNVFQADDCDAFASDVDEAPTAQTMFMANLSSADPVTDEAGPSYDSDILSEDLLLNVDNVFQADDCDAFDSDVDEAPTAQTMFIANLSSTDPVNDKAGSSYDLDNLSEVHDHDHYQDAVCKHHEVHEMHDDVQPNYVVDSHADYTSDSNMILYDQYVKDNAVPVVQSNVSSVPNDAYMMILNDMHEQPAQHLSVTTHNNVVDKSLTAKLATYKNKLNYVKNGPSLN